jgi:hypothetical protein
MNGWREVSYIYHVPLSIAERVNSYARAALMKEEGGGCILALRMPLTRNALCYIHSVLVLYYRFPHHTAIQSIHVHPVCRDGTGNAS